MPKHTTKLQKLWLQLKQKKDYIIQNINQTYSDTEIILVCFSAECMNVSEPVLEHIRMLRVQISLGTWSYEQFWLSWENMSQDLLTDTRMLKQQSALFWLSKWSLVWKDMMLFTVSAQE